MVLKVVGMAASRTFRVLWMLEEIGCPYEYINARPHAPEVASYGLTGKIPVVETDQGALGDSTAILQYLADRHERFTAPSGTFERALQDSKTCLVLDEFDSCLWTAAKHTFVLPAEFRVKAVRPSLRWEFAQAARRVARILEPGPYLGGEEPIVPDFILGHCGRWARAARMDHDCRALSEYFSRIEMRPAYQRIAAIEAAQLASREFAPI